MTDHGAMNAGGGPGGPGARGAAAPQAQDEPDLLRDQFRQLLRYRPLIALGVLLGVLGGAWLGVIGSRSYAATGEVTLRAPASDPLAEKAGGGQQELSMGSEQRTALSNVVAVRAAKKLRLDAGDADALTRDLQVTNPPETQMLRFTYTAHSPATAARRANAFVRAYLRHKEAQSERLIDGMVGSYEQQRRPLARERDRLAAEIERAGGQRAPESALSAHSSAVSRLAEIDSSISSLEALNTTPGEVVTKAAPPSSPSGPGLLPMLALGAAVGIGIGLLLAWGRLVFDPTVRSSGDVVRALHAPVLGTLPQPTGTRRQRRGRGDQHGGSETLLAGGRLAEEYRSVAFRLAYDEAFARRRRLLVVAPRGSIATALAASVNLSAAFAEMGKDVLLIEADLRTPSLTEQLHHADGVRPGWARAPGHGTIGWPTGRRVPIDAGESGVFDLVPGHRVSNVPRALTSSAVTQLIGHADDESAVLVVLAPAVLSYADAIALTDRVDAVLVVCDPREVRRDDLDRVRELVAGAGGVLLGAVLHSEGGGTRETRGAHESEVGVGAGDRRMRAGAAEETGLGGGPYDAHAGHGPAAYDAGAGTDTGGLRIVDPEQLDERSGRR